MTAQLTNNPATAQAQASAKWELLIDSVEPEFTPLAEANGNLVQFKRESLFARDIILASAGLQKCPVGSILKAIRNVAAVGLTLNPAMKLAYLIPRDGECCLDLSFRGLTKVAIDSGAILATKTVVVREHDHFEYMGPLAVPIHKIDVRQTDEQRGPIVAAYNVAEVPPGKTFVTELLTRDNIEQIRKFALSKAKDPTNPRLPWNQWPEEQIKKTGVRRGSKGWPANDRLSAAVALLNDNDGSDDLIEHDITPGAPLLTQSRGRPDPAAFVQASRQQQASEDPECQAFISALEKNIREQGLSYYEHIYATLSKQQRKWLGKDGHERMWALGNEVDAARFDAQKAAAAQQS